MVQLIAPRSDSVKLGIADVFVLYFVSFSFFLRRLPLIQINLIIELIIVSLPCLFSLQSLRLINIHIEYHFLVH